MLLGNLINTLEQFAPPSLQENYDNAGLLVGNKNQEIQKAIVAFDVTEEVLDEALQNKAQLIISHHPIIFGGIKKLNGNSYVERIVIKAIKNDIALYALHTNLDNVLHGTNSYLANHLGLKSQMVLRPMADSLMKLVVFCPKKQANLVREAMFGAGAGRIGNYDNCSFNTQGVGTFRGNASTHPFVGKPLENHHEEEERVETILPKHLKSKVVNAMRQAHPYEEVAYDLYKIENSHPSIGAGIIGELPEKISSEEFLKKLKNLTKASCIRYTNIHQDYISKVALCGGSGAFLIQDAIAQKADIYISGDMKYHEFFDADKKIILADIGHFESEQFTCEILYEYIKEKFPTFAVLKSDINTNPVNYL